MDATDILRLFYISFKFCSIVALLLSFNNVCFAGVRPWIRRDSY